MQIRTAEERDYENIKALYEEAFPKEERKEFALIVRKHPNVRLEVMEEDNQFCGFLTYILYRDIVFGDYLAVTDNMRGKNVGTQVLTWMKEKYPDQRIGLEIETPDESAPNQEQRLRRKAFYERNGFSLTGLRASVYVNDYCLMSRGGTITMEEYLEVLRIMMDRPDMENITKELPFPDELCVNLP